MVTAQKKLFGKCLLVNSFYKHSFLEFSYLFLVSNRKFKIRLLPFLDATFEVIRESLNLKFTENIPHAKTSFW